jgi:hypothetical protein
MRNFYRGLNLYLPRTIETEVGIKASVKGAYNVKILHPRGTVTEPFGDKWISNLITNFGFDQWMQANTFVTPIGAAGFARVGSGTTTPAFTDTALVTQVASTSTFTGSGTSTVNDTVNGAVTMTQSWDFAAAGSAQSLNEVGLATAASGANLYTRSLFPSTISLSTGDVLRLAYSLTFSCPATVTPITVSQSAINGFNPSGQMKVCGVFQAATAGNSLFGSILAAGGAVNGTDLFWGFRGSQNAFLVTAPSTFPAVNVDPTTSGSVGTSSSSAGTYTNGSFTRTAQYIWNPSTPASTLSGITGIVFGLNASRGLFLLFTATQTKANTNTLTVNMQGTMARA